ncbi:MAG TPA: LemA family protein [Firmicutes bacterium]|nr:LemA family protein [Bacillota bacterium]
MRRGCLFGIAGLVIVLLVAAAGFSWVMGIQRNMVNLQQSVLAQEGRYGAALETLSEKIKGIWAMEKDFLEHEKDTLTDVIKARAQALDSAGQEFAAAAAEGDPQKTIEAATRFREAAEGLALSVNVNALREAYPQLFSPAIVQQTMRGLEEAVNEIRTALDDWQVAIRDYNTYRSQWPQSFVGGALNFPASYDYYKAEKAKLDMDALMPKD